MVKVVKSGIEGLVIVEVARDHIISQSVCNQDSSTG